MNTNNQNPIPNGHPILPDGTVDENRYFVGDVEYRSEKRVGMMWCKDCGIYKLKHKTSCSAKCQPNERKDNTDVIFKEVK